MFFGVKEFDNVHHIPSFFLKPFDKKTYLPREN